MKTIQARKPLPSYAKAEIARNWDLPSDNINSCVPPELWPLNEPDPEKWHVDILSLLYEASELSQGANDLFAGELGSEIHSRQLRNKSAQGKAGYMTVTDLRKTCKRFRSMREEADKEWGVKDWEPTTEKANKKADEKEKSNSNPARPSRSNGKPPAQPSQKPTTRTRSAQNKQTAAQRRKAESQQNDTAVNDTPNTEENSTSNPVPKKQPTKRPPSKRTTSSALPHRPARKPRTLKSPLSHSAIPLPPPFTPANPPSEHSSAEGEDPEQENAPPPEPVSGRHIYGDYIKPSTLAFHPPTTAPTDEAPARRTRRQTRKRARADQDEKDAEIEPPPTHVQVDSDPRDIDATGFLSELDPREQRFAGRRRRMKPRLSRLVDEPVGEPAWSQDVIELGLETPGVTPGLELDGAMDVGGMPAVDVGDSGEAGSEEVLGIEMLTELLPGIPDHATDEERGVLEDRIKLLHRDIAAYKRCVWEIEERGAE